VVRYPDVSRRTMQEILDRGARVMVAFTETPDGERRVLGYSVSEPERRLLHWLYVKRDFRGMGIGQRLLDDVVKSDANKTSAGESPWEYTHRTRASDKFLGRGWKHNPVPARVKQAA
jgi:GNAT superfamily N-acetyltransferase